MKLEIKNRSELANFLGMAFKTYANNLENHWQLEPYLPYMEGEKAVTLTVKLYNGGISVEKGPDTDVFTAEIGVLEGKVKDMEKEIKSLNILLEEQKPPEEDPLIGTTPLPLSDEFYEEPIGVEIIPKDVLEEPVKEKKKKQRGKRK